MTVDKLTGIIIDAKLPVAASLARRIVLNLRKLGMNYDRMLFPYVDNLILTKERPQLFGNRILLETCDIAMIERCAAEVCADVGFCVVQLDCSYTAIRDFLNAKCPRGKDIIYLGDIELMLSGDISPWLVRECSRRLASFAEHIYRQFDANIVGFCGERLAVRGMDPQCSAQLCEIYENKNGTGLKIKRTHNII